MKSILIVFCLVIVDCLALPTVIHNIEFPGISCQIDSSSRDECLKGSIQDVLPKLQNGIENLNIPPIDPYTIDERTYEYKRGDIYGRLSLKSGTVQGVSKAEIKDVRTEINDNNMSAELDVFVPRIHAEGLYKGSGKISSYKSNSKGLYNITLIDVASTIKLKGVFVTKNGQQHLRIVNIDVIPVIGDFKVDITGISPDPQLNQLRLDFINQYWPLIYRDIVPQTKDIWGPIVINRINAFLSRVPFQSLLHYGKDYS